MRVFPVVCYNQKNPMKRKRHTEEQIISILKEAESGLSTADLVRKYVSVKSSPH